MPKVDLRDNPPIRNSLIPAQVGQDEFDNIVPDSCQYGRVQFWDERYLKESEPFEWYHPFEYYRETIMEEITCELDGVEGINGEAMEQRILIAGCGTSNMPEDIANEGFRNVTANDISRVAMKMQEERCKGIENLKFLTGNMTDMDLEDEVFDAVIDKALLDSLFCSAMGNTVVAQYVNEVIRILSDGGVFICISRLNPEDALPLLEQFDIDEPFYTPWLIEVQAILKPKQHENEEMNPDDPDQLYWVYIARKQWLMVKNKKIKERKLLEKKKKKAGKKATIKAPNL